MVDSRWDRIKDFSYRHAPAWVQDRLDTRAVLREAQDRLAARHALDEMAVMRAEESERAIAFEDMANSIRWPHADAGTPFPQVYEPAPDGMVRLYRVGPTPGENDKSVTVWLDEYNHRMGVGQTIGRWFTSDVEHAQEYHHYHPAHVLRHVDVSPEEANAWRADLLKLQRFTEHPHTDFFLPAHVANTAQVTGAERTILREPPTKAYDPIQIESYRKRGVDRQSGWDLDR